MLSEIRDLYAYNRWANHRIRAVTATLTPAQLQRDLGSSFPSVVDTLVHMLGAEWIWLTRWKGTSPQGLPRDWDLSTHAGVEARWADLEHDLAEFVSGLTEDRLAAPVSYRNLKGSEFTNRLADLMRHVVNHASYHRGQIVMMLRQLGVDPVSTDLVLFYRERDAAAGGPPA